MLLLRKGFFLFNDRIDRALHYAYCTINAYVRIDDHEIGTFVEAIDWAHNNAANALALVAALSDNMGHRISSWLAECGAWIIPCSRTINHRKR